MTSRCAISRRLPAAARFVTGGAVISLRNRSMDDEFVVTCPYCGEAVEIYLEPELRGTFVQDCEVCCNPWRVRVSGSGDDRVVDIARADGSE
jgi:hypothetical protein